MTQNTRRQPENNQNQENRTLTLEQISRDDGFLTFLEGYEDANDLDFEEANLPEITSRFETYKSFKQYADNKVFINYLKKNPNSPYVSNGQPVFKPEQLDGIKQTYETFQDVQRFSAPAVAAIVQRYERTGVRLVTEDIERMKGLVIEKSIEDPDGFKQYVEAYAKHGELAVEIQNLESEIARLLGDIRENDVDQAIADSKQRVETLQKASGASFFTRAKDFVSGLNERFLGGKNLDEKIAEKEAFLKAVDLRSSPPSNPFQENTDFFDFLNEIYKNGEFEPRTEYELKEGEQTVKLNITEIFDYCYNGTAEQRAAAEAFLKNEFPGLKGSYEKELNRLKKEIDELKARKLREDLKVQGISKSQLITELNKERAKLLSLEGARVKKEELEQIRKDLELRKYEVESQGQVLIEMHNVANEAVSREMAKKLGEVRTAQDSRKKEGALSQLQALRAKLNADEGIRESVRYEGDESKRQELQQKKDKLARLDKPVWSNKDEIFEFLFKNNGVVPQDRALTTREIEVINKEMPEGSKYSENDQHYIHHQIWFATIFNDSNPIVVPLRKAFERYYGFNPVEEYDRKILALTSEIRQSEEELRQSGTFDSFEEFAESVDAELTEAWNLKMDEALRDYDTKKPDAVFMAMKNVISSQNFGGNPEERKQKVLEFLDEQIVKNQKSMRLKLLKARIQKI